MPVTDSDVCITEILGNHLSFQGVLKQNVGDFIVNEVLLSGQVARLTELPQFPTPVDNTNVQENQNDEQKTEETAKEIDDETYRKLDQLFPNSSMKEASNLVRQMIEKDQTQLTLPSCDKTQRTAVHGWVRENIPMFVTDTVDINDQKAVRLRHKQLCRPWKRRRPNQSHKQSDSARDNTFDPRETRLKNQNQSTKIGRNTYVSFLLWKRNRDTNEALIMLGKALHIPWSAFTYAGTKDKRGITTQLVQVRGISESRFAHANRNIGSKEKHRRSLVVGNIQVLNKPKKALSLGDLKGNRFTIVLRDCHFEEGGEANVYTAVNNLKQYGFVNYFGLQRFGSGVSATHETGFAMLRGDFEEVCNRILLPLKVGDENDKGEGGMRPERRNMVECLEKFARKEISADELLTRLPKWMNIERSIAMSFKDDESRGMKKYDYKKAFSKLPRNLRRIYAHAVQSFIWNAMASKRVQLSMPNSPDRLHAIQGDLVLEENGHSGDDFNYDTPVHTVTEEEETCSKFLIEQVVIPVVGSEVKVPTAKYGDVARDILEENKIDLSNRLTSEYGIKGTYRRLIAKPKDLEMKIMDYIDKSEELVSCEIDELLTEEQKQQKSDDQPGTKVNLDGKNSDTHHKVQISRENEEEKPGIKREEKDGDMKGDQKKRKAVVISFTLGCAEYATMLIRELTRKESSTANQKAMQELKKSE